MSAAHCAGVGNGIQIGRWDRSNTFGYEAFGSVAEYIHPNYDDSVSLSYDKMIVKIDGQTTVTPTRLNFDQNVPIAGTAAMVMGWGLTNADDQSSTSVRLKEASVNVLTNEACVDAKSPLFPWDSYRGSVFDDMLCAIADGQDSCQGDSGGPLMLLGSDASNDVQIGVVSWGYGCAIQGFPGVYSRLSADADWITQQVCQLSSNPPAYFNCDGGVAPATPLPTLSPTTVTAISPQGNILATIQIFMDEYPQDVGFRVDRLGLSLESVIRRQAGLYTTPRQVVTETFFLEEGELYSFTIFDVRGDGICCSFGQGNYTLSLDGSAVVVVSPADFGGGREHDFVASSTDSSTPPPAPVNPGDSYLTLEISFDEYPSETGWIIRKVDSGSSSSRVNTIVAYRSPRTYTPDQAEQTVSEIIPVESGSATYILDMTDSYGDGLCCTNGNGKYTVYKGGVGDGIILAEGTAANTPRESTTFAVSGDEGGPQGPVTVSGTPASGPTLSPVSLIDPIKVTVVIHPDDFPEDIGWYINDATTGNKMMERPAGYYSAGQTENFIEGSFFEALMLESNTAYEFVITDEYENGLCCSNGVGFYALQNDHMGLIDYGSRFTAEQRVMFVTDGNYPLQLKIKFDMYPKELFWYLDRLDLPVGAASAGKKVSYKDGDQDVEENLLVDEGGLYRLILVDSQGDGICCEHGQGSIEIIGGENKQSLGTVSGDFGSYTFHMFLAGSALTPPSTSTVRTLTLRIVFDEYPEEISWFLTADGSATAVAQVARSSTVEQQIVAFGPEKAYSSDLAATTFLEAIEVEEIPDGSVRTFTMVIVDSGGDGLCCKYGNGQWQLLDGPAANNEVLISGDMKYKSREQRTFTLNINGGFEIASPTPAPTRGSIGSILLNSSASALRAGVLTGFLSAIFLMTLF